jgi:hypothetical protein
MCHDSFFEVLKKQLTLAPNTLSLPDWQWQRDGNDRLEVCSVHSMKIYTSRISLAPNHLQKTGGHLPAERFLQFRLHKNGIYPIRIPLRARRVRANGYAISSPTLPAKN